MMENSVLIATKPSQNSLNLPCWTKSTYATTGAFNIILYSIQQRFSLWRPLYKLCYFISCVKCITHERKTFYSILDRKIQSMTITMNIQCFTVLFKYSTFQTIFLPSHGCSSIITLTCYKQLMWLIRVV